MTWKYKKFGESYPGGNRLLTFEVTSIGAPIHNIEMCLYMDTRKVVRSPGQPALVPMEHKMELTPLYTVSDPLNAGQSQEYDLSLMDFEEKGRSKAVKDALMRLDYKAVGMRVYCNGQRKVLKRISSKKMKSMLDEFFQLRHILPEFVGAEAEANAGESDSHA